MRKKLTFPQRHPQRPIEWRSIRAHRFTDDRFVDDIVQRLISSVEGYEGDYALHVMGDDGRLLLIVRDQDKRLVVYDCRIERYGIATEPPSNDGDDSGPIRRRPLKDWF